MAWTQTEAHALRRALTGLDPRNTAGRPTAQHTYDCLVLLAERAGKAFQMTLRGDEREALRQLVDDLYRTQAQDGPAAAIVSWHWRSRPNVAELVEAITAVSGGALHARNVDASTDDYILAISRQPLDDAAALAAWEASR